MCHLMVFSKGDTECIWVYRLVKDSFVESSDAECTMPMCCDKDVILFLVKYSLDFDCTLLGGQREEGGEI